MSSSFTLTLDTTPPTIEIIAPNYTSRNIETEIIIKANEDLSLYQDIFAIDSQGERYDFTFNYNTNEFIGIVRFNVTATGIATIYAQLKDEVHNTSSLVSKTINIIGGEKLKLDISDFQRQVILNEKHRKVDMNDYIRLLASDIKTRDIITKERIRQIDIKDKEVK